MTDSIKQIAERIKEVRENSGLTPQAVADQLQVPLSVYNQYESAEADIPISVLYEMARIFKVDLTDLLTGSSPKLRSFCLVREGEGIEIERYKGYKFQSLAYNFINKKIEPLLVLIEPEENKQMSLVTHNGQEFNYCLEGQIRVILGGQEIQLNPGDSLYFDPTIPHGQMAVNGQPAKFLTVIVHD